MGGEDGKRRQRKKNKKKLEEGDSGDGEVEEEKVRGGRQEKGSE